MYRYNADHLVTLARNMEILRRIIEAPPAQWNALAGPQPKNDKQGTVRAFLVGLKKACGDADLGHSAELIHGRISNPPATAEGMQILFESIIAEMKGRLYLRCPSERALYWQNDDLLSASAKERFLAGASDEIREAGTAFACGLYTACVFHSMRAVEAAIRVVAANLGVPISTDDDMKKAVDGIGRKAREIEAKPKYPEKRAESQFYSELSLQAGQFKDAWRNYVAHAKATYTEAKALEVMTATRQFLEKASERFADPSSSIPPTP